MHQDIIRQIALARLLGYRLVIDGVQQPYTNRDTRCYYLYAPSGKLLNDESNLGPINLGNWRVKEHMAKHYGITDSNLIQVHATELPKEDTDQK